MQTYLLNDISDTPPCVNPECGHGYSPTFLEEVLTKSFRLTTFKRHREQVLFDRERAKLPGAQLDAERYKAARVRMVEVQAAYATESEKLEALKTPEIEKALRVKLKWNRVKRLEPTKEIKQIKKTYKALLPELKAFKNSFKAQSAVVSRLRMERNRIIDHTLRSFGRVAEAGPVAAEKRATFIMNCPANNCNGFLSTAWKCGLCEQWTCPDCREIKGSTRDVDHTCDPDKVATVQLLNKEAKSCPKCGVQICKIEGCNQMWCTHCNTGFDWQTGKVANGPVHNPHYFDWLRGQGLQPQPQTQGGCGALDDLQLAQAMRGAQPVALANKLRSVLQLVRHVQHYELPNQVQTLDNEFHALRVQYMVGELVEANWKVKLQRLEKAANVQNSVQQVKAMFVAAGQDLLRQILAPQADLNQVESQVDQLLAYSNEALLKIGKQFNCKAQTLTLRA